MYIFFFFQKKTKSQSFALLAKHCSLAVAACFSPRYLRAVGTADRMLACVVPITAVLSRSQVVGVVESWQMRISVYQADGDLFNFFS